MSNKIGKQSLKFKNKPQIIGRYSLVGEKEGQGSFKDYFDYILKNDMFGEKTFEHAERKMLEHTILKAINNAKLSYEDIDLILSGDLLNQIISSTYSARHFKASYIGVYGACSAMAETMAIGASLVDGKYFNNVICATASHFATAEKQFRSPLELGAPRPPVSQWTVTGAACNVLSLNGSKKNNVITGATLGRVEDYGITDANNMGAAMAPAAMSTLIQHFKDFKSSPEDYDLILTGDLGKLGSEILMDLMEREGIILKSNYGDCGQMMFTNKQKSFQGGSGCACSATIINSYVCKKLEEGVFNKVLYLATGALMSQVSAQQGDSIPGIAHAVVIEKGEN